MGFSFEYGLSRPYACSAMSRFKEFTPSGKQVTKEIIVHEKAQIFAGSAKAKLTITEVLNTTKQAQQPVSRYNCEILY